jgi:hypothetical protein
MLVKKNDESDVHLPQRQKKVVTYSVYFIFIFIFLSIFLKVFFGRFVTRGVQKHEKTHLGSSQKMRLFDVTKNAAVFFTV